MIIRSIKNKVKHSLLIGAVSLSLSGCVSLLIGGGSPPRYTLEAVDFTDSLITEKIPGQLIIADPRAEAAFDTAQIALSIENLQYEYYSSGEWSDRAPRLLGIFLERSFENSRGIQAVGDRTTVPVGDYILQTDIRSFHIEKRDDVAIARISYYARLYSARNESIASKLFSFDEPIEGNGLTVSIEAFNRAAKRTGRLTVDWTLDNMRKANAEKNLSASSDETS